jgi:multidrug efflux pump subunit AcrB
MPRASRADAATGIALISAGVSAGVRRERDRLVDIVLRGSGPEAQDPGALLDQPIWSPATGSDVPLAQLVDGFDVVARDTLVGRRDGEPMVTVQANVVDGVTPPGLRRDPARHRGHRAPPGLHARMGRGVRERGRGAGLPRPAEAAELRHHAPDHGPASRPAAPDGRDLDDRADGGERGGAGAPGTGLHLPLTAPLGLLSPSGTLIENTIVPVKEIDPQAGCGIERREAILDASVSRLRPVMRAAVAAILGKASAPPRPSRSWRASASRRS